jgi:hypothetical protein
VAAPVYGDALALRVAAAIEATLEPRTLAPL